MKGILSYGAYIPYNRLKRKKIKEFFGTSALSGEKAVAGFDEDSVTMGVEAALDCLIEIDEKSVDTVYFATTSGPYEEKSSIPTIVMALDLRKNVRGMESAHSLRAGTSAILGAHPEDNTLVIASDCRLGAPSGQNEQILGDGAAAFLIGSGDGIIARIVDEASSQHEVVSQWRSQSDDFLQNWEDRFASHVYLQNVTQTITEFTAKHEITPDSVSKVIISGPGNRAYLQVAKKLGLKDEQIQNPLFAETGAAGTAHAAMMLISALEEAKPQDKILLINYAEGTDILLFEVTDAIKTLPKRKGIKGYMSIKNNDMSYSDYLKWKDLIAIEAARRPDKSRPSAPAMHRNCEQNLGFYGSKCLACGTPQFPIQRVCAQCKTKDQMEPYRFADRAATIVTYAADYLAATPAPPLQAAVIDFVGGGRIISDLTDSKPEELEIGMEVEMTFRRLYEAGGIHNYFWKARPKR
jgi:hydroxymethylglutaryl-CoA synthase